MGRKAFEKWAVERYGSPDLSRDGKGTYNTECIALMWNAWKTQDKRYYRVVRAAKELKGSVHISNLPLYLKELNEAIQKINEND